MAQLEYCDYTERAIERGGFLAEELVAPMPKTRSKSSPTYYSTLKLRVREWNAFCQTMNLKAFHRLAATIGIAEHCKYELWMLISEVHYFISKPEDFFEGLMELAIEEKAKFRSFSKASDLRLLLADLQSTQMTDESLLKIYLLVRDGWDVLPRA
jgi:hypothetical protein